MSPEIDETCPTPTISALSSRSRTSVLIELRAGFSSFVQALTRSAFKSDSEREGVVETSEGTEENKGMFVDGLVFAVRCWGANAVATPTNDKMLVVKDNCSRIVDLRCCCILCSGCRWVKGYRNWMILCDTANTNTLPPKKDSEQEKSWFGGGENNAITITVSLISLNGMRSVSRSRKIRVPYFSPI